MRGDAGWRERGMGYAVTGKQCLFHETGPFACWWLRPQTPIEQPRAGSGCAFLRNAFVRPVALPENRKTVSAALLVG